MHNHLLVELGINFKTKVMTKLVDSLNQDGVLIFSFGGTSGV